MVIAGPPRSAPPKLVTAEELQRMSKDEFRGELIRGRLCEMPPPGNEHGVICLRLGSKILLHVEEHELGMATSNDAGVVLERGPDTVRGPDLAYFSRERFSPSGRATGYPEVPPNLVVEVKSPSDSLSEVHDKAVMWISYGVETVWLVLPDSRSVDVYQAGADVVSVTEPNQLDGLHVLPGFSCSLEEIFGPAPPVDEPAAR